MYLAVPQVLLCFVPLFSFCMFVVFQLQICPGLLYAFFATCLFIVLHFDFLILDFMLIWLSFCPVTCLPVCLAFLFVLTITFIIHQKKKKNPYIKCLEILTNAVHYYFPKHKTTSSHRLRCPKISL